MKLQNIIIALALIFGSVNIGYSKIDGLYTVVYEADRDGKRISGSLEDLLQHVRNGNPIRVGWELGKKGPGLQFLEHWTDAGFLTIHKEHVFAQIKSIYGQATSAPSVEVPFVNMLNNEPDGWVAILGTNGLMQQKFKADPVLIDA